MKDVRGDDIQVGDFIVYTGGGVTAPDLKFGWVRKANPATDKLWVEHANFDCTPKMQQTFDRNIRQWVETDKPCGVSIVNHTHNARFMII